MPLHAQMPGLMAPSGSQGCLAAFSLVFLGEFGDKTFFTAALLAMRLGRGVSFAGSMLALAAMSLIGVGIGALFAAAPDGWAAGLPVGELLGVVLLVAFGVSALRKAAAEVAQSKATPSSNSGSSDTCPLHADGSIGHSSGTSSQAHAGTGSSSSSSLDSSSCGSELQEAEAELAAATSSGRLGQQRHALASVLEVAVLVFLAEWGDRSMLATVALGAAQHPMGVALGALGAYCAATGLAVVGGSLCSRYVREQTLDLISGVLFLLFAAASVVALL